MRKVKIKKKYKVGLGVIIFLVIISAFLLSYYELDDIKGLLPVNKTYLKEIERKQKEDYETCLKEPFKEEELTIDLVNKENEINEFIKNKNYQASFKYEDLTTNFTYSYDASKIYYGCSLIKLVDAIYLINKAILGEIDLDKETVVYKASYKKDSSLEMDKRHIGEAISLRDLITYAITVSDNTAHMMLIDYIGFNNLKSYGQSLGAKVILSGGDKYGNQTANDTNIYLKEAYRIITENAEYGPFLKEIMGNNNRNAFNTEDIKIYHKYGSWSIYYHDIGLNLDIENPYAISILTLHEGRNYQEVVQNIHAKVKELHDMFNENRKKTCYAQVYEIAS